MKELKNPYAFASDTENGMTLRDYFAGQCLAGMLANPEFVKMSLKDKRNLEKEYGEMGDYASMNQSWHADTCYKFAEALLRKRAEIILNEDI